MFTQEPAAPTAPFAALMARANGVAAARLADTVGLLDGVAVAGIFEEAFADIDGLGTVSPVVFVPSAAATHVEQGRSQFVRGNLLDGTVYRVAGIEPDGAGMTLLRLRRA